MQKHLWCKKYTQNHAWKWKYKQIGNKNIWYHNMAKGLSILNTLVVYTGPIHFLASHCFQSLIGLPNICFQPYHGGYKFSYFKRLTREHKSHNYFSFGHLFISYVASHWQKSSHITSNCNFYVLLLIFLNMKFVAGYGWKH